MLRFDADEQEPAAQPGMQEPGAPAEEGFSDEPPAPDYVLQPEIPHPDHVVFTKIFDLVIALGRSHPNPAEGCKWNPIMAGVLWQLVGQHHAHSPDGGAVQVTHAAIATALNVTVKVVRDRLHTLAAFGLIKCVNALDNKRGFFQVGNFYFNPLMVQLVVKRGRKLSKGAITPFIDMGLGRDQTIRRPQGWEGHDCEYGSPEPSAGTPEAYGLQLAPWAKAMGDELEALEEQATLAVASGASARLRREERERRGRAAEAFVRGCATVWQQAHERRGYGTDRPAWEGPYESLSPENKKQFKELRALFERSGGAKVAMAWAVFVHYQPSKDERGKLKFDPALPHVQWVSTDKKPSHFAKHFDALLLDPVARKLITEPGGRGRIAEIFGKVFDVPPAPPIDVAAHAHKAAKT